MMRKVAHILLWLLLVAWFPVIMGFVRSSSSEVLCKQISVEITDTLNSRFVLEDDVREILASSGLEIQGYPVAGIDTRSLEALLEQSPYIRGAELCYDVSGTLSVLLDQRIPLLRMMPRGKKGYYLDTEGVELPLSGNYVPHVLVVSGSVPEDRKELLEFCRYVAGHELWSKQLVQLYCDRNGAWELVPRVGAHQVLLGSLEGWKEKLGNLELLYAQGLPVHGWNSFSHINLKYKDQIICTKR